MLIIDSHCHVGKGDGLSGPWDTNASFSKYIEWADDYQISKTVFFSVFHSNYAIANLNVARIVSLNPNRFYGFACINAINDANRVFSLIKIAVQKYHFCGIKVHRYDSRISREICEAARYFSLPVLYDIMGEVSQVYMLSQEYPEVNFIIPHLGTFSDDWKVQKSFIAPLTFCQNIFTDFSGVKRFDLLKESIERAGTNKILFGSDGPWLHPGVELEKIFALNLKEKDLRQILSENFLQLIKNVKYIEYNINRIGKTNHLLQEQD